MRPSLEKTVSDVVAVLDKERRTGFCDEHGILQAWLDNCLAEARSDTLHFATRERTDAPRSALSRASIMHEALAKIADGDLTRGRMKSTAIAALAKAKSKLL